MSRIEEKSGKATAWALIAAIVIPSGFGLWFGWPGPWWLYVAFGAVVFLGGLSGWVQSVQKDEIHRATLEMNERQKRQEQEQSGDKLN
ncbi:hypothetical protein ACFFUA_38030 [Streptomyces heliomycini]|uniref:Integral membrane protein n=1 Tax=Streptomyces heliomycini TaxID=284032 RepID=A0ABV5LMJ3_9ACTN